MRWHDYLVCIIFADFISALLMVGSILVVVPVILFYVYADLRKIQEDHWRKR